MGTFGIFYNFVNNKNDFLTFFIKLITYFRTSPIKKAKSQSNYFDKKCKKSIFAFEKIQKYQKCPALPVLFKIEKLTQLYLAKV